MIGFPIVGIRCAVNDGASHAVDSSEMAFKTAALMGFREAYDKAGATILEPIMKVEIDAPTEFQGSVVGQVNQRRGVILETVGGDSVSITCEVPLNAMFGYSTDLRSATQGKGTFTMEFARYAIAAAAGQSKEEMKKRGLPREARRGSREEVVRASRSLLVLAACGSIHCGAPTKPVASEGRRASLCHELCALAPTFARRADHATKAPPDFATNGAPAIVVFVSPIAPPSFTYVPAVLDLAGAASETCKSSIDLLRGRLGPGRFCSQKRSANVGARSRDSRRRAHRRSLGHEALS